VQSSPEELAVQQHRRLPYWPLAKEQWLTLLSLLALTGIAWLLLFRMAASMAMVDMAMAGMPMPWSLADALLMLAMWSVMMVGMMLPSALPMILLYQQMLRRYMTPPQRHLALLLFCLAYLLVWSGFSLIATALQWGLDRLSLLSPQMRSQSQWLGATLLMGAGAYQWLPSKSACLAHCRGPVQFLLGHWRSGVIGGWSMGLKHGLYCLGCCWMLMGLLFVGGVMNLLWAALIGACVLLEKLLPGGIWLGRIAGLLLFVWGMALLLG
jgi:predicted metal-binding membrane protein